MIVPRLLSFRDGLVGAAALLTVAILGLRVIVGDVKPADALRCLGLVAGFVVLLTLLPPIIRFQWSRLPFMNQLGFVVLVLVMVAVLSTARKRSQTSRRK